MARQRYRVGDLVRFKDAGRVDWEVVFAGEIAGVGQPQRLVLTSGMTGRRANTTSEHVVPREMRMDKEALAAWQR